MENVVGSKGDDTIEGSSADNTLFIEKESEIPIELEGTNRSEGGVDADTRYGGKGTNIFVTYTGETSSSDADPMFDVKDGDRIAVENADTVGFSLETITNNRYAVQLQDSDLYVEDIADRPLTAAGSKDGRILRRRRVVRSVSMTL